MVAGLDQSGDGWDKVEQVAAMLISSVELLPEQESRLLFILMV